MGRYVASTTGSEGNSNRIEYRIRIGVSVFAVVFDDLAKAREAAEAINKTGRSVEIYEKVTGNIVATLRGWPTVTVSGSDIKLRFIEYGHDFNIGRTLCSCCSLTLREALESRFSCNTVLLRGSVGGQQLTLSKAIDLVENPLLDRFTAGKKIAGDKPSHAD